MCYDDDSWQDRMEAQYGHPGDVQVGGTMFTKEHYEAIAKVIQEASTYAITVKPLTPVIPKTLLVAKLIDLFEQDNGNFDQAKFAEVCYRE